jgi:hypothetical protein
MVPEYFVGSFDTGDTTPYVPAKELASFELVRHTYPQDAAVLLTMAEKDAGGFSQFLHDLYEAIRAEIQIVLAALGAAAGAAIGAAIGGSLGTTVGGPIGTVIGVVAGLILGAIVGWIVEISRDDIFTPQIATIHCPTADFTFEGGALTSPIITSTYDGFGGRYRISYSWSVVR